MKNTVRTCFPHVLFLCINFFLIYFFESYKLFPCHEINLVLLQYRVS
jgi:hypothetical protein